MTLDEHIKELEMKVKNFEKTASEIRTKDFYLTQIYNDMVITCKERIELLKELKTLRKAYELLARDFALKNYCIVTPECFDSCTEQDRKKCHSKEWIMKDYLEEAQKDDIE